jgi:hypothetical protein
MSKSSWTAVAGIHANQKEALAPFASAPNGLQK